ncbi:MAG: putative OB-fold protein, partial [Glaciecola sp.]
TAPHLVGVIELEEGTRYVCELVEVEPAHVAIGMPMSLRWVQMDDELTLPVFGPAGPAPTNQSPSEVGS